MHISDNKYAIVDLETTGGLASRDKITEVGIVIIDGHEIVDTYTSLINPGRSIPPHITRITGIHDGMVEDAPYFYEVAKDIVEYTEGCIFVAHNVRFDYSFLKEEYGRLGYTFSRKLLDTVTLSRKTFPGLRSYSLGNLIKHFDLSVNARHRALEDARATAIIFQKILQSHNPSEINHIINHGVKTARLPKELSIEKLHDLPEKAGVYYMYNTFGHVVYVGKSINIKKRVFQHFAATTKKANNMSRIVADIQYIETGHELIAQILESYEIKKLLPELNKAQRTTLYNYFSYSYIDEEGYQCYGYLKSNKKNRKDKNILAFYGSRPAALSDLSKSCAALELCLTKMGINKNDGACHSYHLDTCRGACISKELPEDYNLRAEGASDMMKRLFDENFILILDGRNNDEKGIVLVEENHYRGYGYIGIDESITDIEEMKECIQYTSVNPEVDNIIRTYLDKKPKTKKIRF